MWRAVHRKTGVKNIKLSKLKLGMRKRQEINNPDKIHNYETAHGEQMSLIYSFFYFNFKLNKTISYV